MAQENSTELMNNENLYQVMISEEAYYEAEKRGFASLPFFKEHGSGLP